MLVWLDDVSASCRTFSAAKAISTSERGLKLLSVFLGTPSRATNWAACAVLMRREISASPKADEVA